MNILVHLHLISFITPFLPLLASSGRSDGRTTRYPSCTDSQREAMHKMPILDRFRRFFEPDCQKKKFIFQADRQGCLGALRWLQENFGPETKLTGSKRPFFKLIICTHRPCSQLPLFRRCGSNQTDHSIPRTFRNGCRQCATSCKEILAGRRRYERLHMDKCPTPIYRKHSTPVLVESQPPSPPKTTKPQPYVANKTTAAPTQTTIYSTLMQQRTTELLTTQVMTTEEIRIYEPQPIEETRLHQHCVVKHLTFNVQCPSTTEPLSQVKLPDLPPWKNGG